MFIKNSSKILIATLLLVVIVVVIDFAKVTTLTQKIGFVLTSGVLALIFQKISDHYANRPLKLPRWLQRLTLGRAAMEEIDRINDIIDPIDSALCRLESRLEFDLVKKGKIPAMEVNGIVAAIDKLFTTEGGDVSDN